MNHKCRTHQLYYLTCHAYLLLVKRAGNRCEACGAEPTGLKPLGIDHDHALGRWAVRGLLCGRCNRNITKNYRAPEWARDYLSRPFHVEAGLMPPADPVTDWERLNANVPVPLHGAIRTIAAGKGQTISEYVRKALEDAYARDRYGTHKQEEASEQ